MMPALGDLFLPPNHQVLGPLPAIDRNNLINKSQASPQT